MTMACLERIPSGEEKGDGVFESVVVEEGLPAGSRNQGVRGAEIVIGESPPAVGEAKDQVDEADRNGALEEQEQGAGSGQVQDMEEGLAQIPGGMEDIGGQDEIELLGRESLSGGVLFDVQELIANEGKSGELFLGLGDEQGRDIGKDVLGLIRGEAGEDEGK